MTLWHFEQTEVFEKNFRKLIPKDIQEEVIDKIKMQLVLLKEYVEKKYKTI
ncbi:hypothetical protein JXA85_01145 [Candidatus Woesearchaeota archaeon]|nr:hypothetical protein [Candidatus Woesearchaeota archaeon]